MIGVIRSLFLLLTACDVLCEFPNKSKMKSQLTLPDLLGVKGVYDQSCKWDEGHVTLMICMSGIRRVYEPQSSYRSSSEKSDQLTEQGQVG
jgi:hypothetical protein